MKIPIINYEFNFSLTKKGNETTQQPESNYSDSYSGNVYGQQYPIITKKFDGEKTLGELGVITNSIPDYYRIRLRAYDAELKTDLVKIITDKFFKWIVGSGLKLQSEINKEVLKMEGIDEDFMKLQEIIEARFSLWASSKISDYSRMDNLHVKANEAKKTAFVGGDCLVVCRVEKEGVNVQVIDGSHIKNPYDFEKFKEIKDKGNIIQHGIEIDKRGQHVGFFVEVIGDGGLVDYEYIPAYGEKSKLKLAWLVYGDKNRVDHIRGISCITSILEKVNKLDRYTEAAVGKAEQAAKIAYTIEHNQFSTGESPIEKVVREKAKIAGEVQDGYVLADGLANRIMETTNNQAWNMPIGSSLKDFSTDIETDYAAFESAVFNKLCASVGIPPEVALQMYNSNYSASRAAINAFEYIVELGRDKHSDDFYKPVYKVWLYNEILRNKIDAPGYILGVTKEEYMITESYAQCRFIGKNMPHIDPLKEIKAIRAMLGDAAKNEVPLISLEQATEMLNAGEWSENYEKYKIEIENVEFPEIKQQDETI